jgi:hypothetical protein
VYRSSLLGRIRCRSRSKVKVVLHPKILIHVFDCLCISLKGVLHRRSLIPPEGVVAAVYDYQLFRHMN